MNRKQRRERYNLLLNELWEPSFIVDIRYESRVNENRKRARMASICKNRKTGGCSDKNYPFRQKAFRKEVAKMWRLTFSTRQIKMLAIIGNLI